MCCGSWEKMNLSCDPPPPYSTVYCFDFCFLKMYHYAPCLRRLAPARHSGAGASQQAVPIDAAGGTGARSILRGAPVAAWSRPCPPRPARWRRCAVVGPLGPIFVSAPGGAEILTRLLMQRDTATACRGRQDQPNPGRISSRINGMISHDKYWISEG